jgi:hypothetical protein
MSEPKKADCEQDRENDPPGRFFDNEAFDAPELAESGVEYRQAPAQCWSRPGGLADCFDNSESPLIAPDMLFLSPDQTTSRLSLD